MKASAEVEITDESPDSELAAHLLSRYYEELDSRFPGGFDPGATPPLTEAEFEPPNGTVLVARVDGKAVGCGAVRKLDRTTAEVKRMWVDPATRGQGVGRALLAALEERASRFGYNLVRLDTSAHLPEALALYRASGYFDIVRYNDNPYAAFWLEKHVSD